MKPQQFPSPQPGGQLQVVEFKHPAGFCFPEESVQLVGSEGLHLPVFQPGQGTAFSRVGWDQLLLHRQLQGGGDHLVEIPHRLGAETFGLFLRLNPLHPASVQHLLVESLEIQGSQLMQRNVPDVGLNMVVQIATVGGMGGGAYLHLCHVLEPDLHPRAQGALSRPGHIHSLASFDGFRQLFLHLCLCFAQDVLVDGFPGLRVSAGGVPSLPATVRAFANAALAVGTLLCHGILPFLCLCGADSDGLSPSSSANYTTYQQSERKSRPLGQSYRNVIICVTGKAGKRPAKHLPNGEKS